MQTNAVFKIPRHGSYPSDICQWTRLMSFSDTPPYGHATAPDVVQIILGLVRRVYPDATKESVWKYGNKDFTIVGRTYFHNYVIVYFHDYTWCLGDMPAEAYDKWAADKGYYAAVPDDLPQC
jgi:hypothetical protein